MLLIYIHSVRMLSSTGVGEDAQPPYVHLSRSSQNHHAHLLQIAPLYDQPTVLPRVVLPVLAAYHTFGYSNGFFLRHLNPSNASHTIPPRHKITEPACENHAGIFRQEVMYEWIIYIWKPRS